MSLLIFHTFLWLRVDPHLYFFPPYSHIQYDLAVLAHNLSQWSHLNVISQCAIEMWRMLNMLPLYLEKYELWGHCLVTNAMVVFVAKLLLPESSVVVCFPTLLTCATPITKSPATAQVFLLGALVTLCLNGLT